jgi:hypothetical protein
MRARCTATCLLLLFTYISYSQNDDKTKNKLAWLNNFSLNYYLDCYYTYDLGVNYVYADKNVNSRPFASTSPFANQFRINKTYLLLSFDYDRYRARFGIQYGDIPLLLAPTEKFLIKNIKQATFGINLNENWWLDIGYLANPMGVETTEQTNLLISNSIGGYGQPGNLIGIRASYNPSEKFSAGIMLFNGYNLVTTTDDSKSLGINFSYKPNMNLSFNYLTQVNAPNDFTGPTKTYCYNNFFITLNFLKRCTLLVQYDVAFQSNALIPKNDTIAVNKTANGMSGMVQLNIKLAKKLSLGGRVEFISDPSQIIMQGVFESSPGLIGIGDAIGISYSPFDKTYFRAEYSYLALNQPLIYYNSNLTFSYRNNISVAFGVHF